MVKNKPKANLKKFKHDYILIVLRVLVLLSLAVLGVSMLATGWSALGYLVLALVCIPITGALYAVYVILKKWVFKFSVAPVEIVAALFLLVVAGIITLQVWTPVWVADYKSGESYRQSQARLVEEARYSARADMGCRPFHTFSKDNEVQYYELYYSHFGPIETQYAQQMRLVEQASDDCFGNKVTPEQMMTSWIQSKKAIETLAIENGGQASFDKVKAASHDQSHCTTNGQPCPILLIENTEEFLQQTR